METYSGMTKIGGTEKFEEIKKRFLNRQKKRGGVLNYMQETAEKYLKYFDWDEMTLNKDMQVLFIAMSRYYKSNTHADFVRVLEWIKKKGNIHPRQGVKVFMKK